MSRPLVIAIDGPSGAGKGTVARALAGRLGYRHVDTGAMYRAVAWKALQEGVDLQQADTVAAIAASADFEVDSRIAIDGYDITTEIRTREMDAAAAIVARHPEVRAVLVDRQRRFDNGLGLVMEGRDIGTVVFPAADVKIFLDASPEERARRRATDTAHAASREPSPLERVAQDLAARDQSDRTRTASPLTRAPDAVHIDTTGVPISSVVDRAHEVVSRALSAAV